MARELPYREGDVFAVPLRDHGYTLGVAARMDHRGGLVAYFFGDRYEEVPTADAVGRLRVGDSILVKRTGDLGLIDKTWPVIMSLPKWRRDDWPIPVFGKEQALTGRCFRLEYHDDDLDLPWREVEVSRSELNDLPTDGLAGSGFIERQLTSLMQQLAR